MIQIKNLFWYLLTFGTNMIIQLISLWFYSKYFSKEDFGLYALISVIGIVTVALSNLGLLTVYQRDFFELNNKLKDDLLISIVTFILISLVFWASITSLNFDVINKLLFKEKINTFYWITIGQIYFVFQSINQFFFAKLKNTYRAKLFSFLSISEKTIALIFSIVLITIKNLTYEALLLGQVISVLCLFGYFLISFLNYSTFRINLKVFLKSLKLAIPLSPVQILKVIGNQSDKYFISYFGNFSGLGLYDVALKLSNVSFIFSTALQNLFSPGVYELLFSKKENKHEIIGKFLTPFLYLSAFFSLLFVLFIEEIIIILLDRTYLKILPIIILLNGLYLVQFFTKQPQLVFAKKTALLSRLSIMLIISNTLFNIPFVYFFNIYGAMTSTLLTGFIYIILYHKYGQKYVPIEYESNKIILVLSIFFSFSTSTLIFYLFQIEYSYRLFYKVFCLLIFILIGFKFIVISKKNFQNILKKR